MTKVHTATLGQRIFATLLNVPFGTIPMWGPQMLAPSGFGASNLLLIETGALLFAVLQTAFVHRLQGSPGAVLAGLRVELVDGRRPPVLVSILRALPFWSLILLEAASRHSAGASRAMSAAGALIVTGFLFVSAAYALAIGRSLLEVLTRTRLVKAYSAFTGRPR